MRLLLVIGLVAGGCSRCNTDASETVESSEALEEVAAEEAREEAPAEVPPPPARARQTCAAHARAAQGR